jgi:hypothetical protein
VNTQETTPEEYVVAKVLEEAKVSVELPEESNATQSSSGSSFSSSGVSETSDAKSPETTDDAFEYIAGFIAKKFKNTHPQLGDFTYRIKSDNAFKARATSLRARRKCFKGPYKRVSYAIFYYTCTKI